VPTIISRIDSVRAAFRPFLSAYMPSTMAPTGRVMNDTPKLPTANSSDTHSSSAGKNSLPMTDAKNP